jgi:GNAT superfamily N-acetyltransferase
MPGVEVPTLGVRAAEAADGAAMGVAHAAAWTEAYAVLFDPEFLSRAVAGRRAGWPHAVGRLLEEGGVLLVGTLGGDVVAFAHAGAASGEPAVAEIYGFYSHPVAWGTGLASLLMAETCGRLRPRWDRAVLWTHRDAGRARRFYEKAGFATTGRERVQTFSDWIGGLTADAPTVEYATRLTGPAAR